jgi:hypothetical protein
MMEDVLEQLKILDYEQDFCEKKTVEPFARTYFAIPASNTGYSIFIVAVCYWLAH